jgi:integrase
VLTSYFEEVSDSKPSGPQARYAAARILEFWGETARVSQVTDARQIAFARWAHAKDLSVSYIARMLSVLSAALRHALGVDAPRVYTWAGTIASKLDVPESEPREWIPSDAQLAAFLDSLTGHQAQHVFCYTIIALNTLARPAAILGLRPSQVVGDLINLNPQERRQTKKRRPTLRVTDTLAPWLEAWSPPADAPYVLHNGSPVGSIRQTFKRKGQDLGFPQLTPYALRHKMATELAARSVSRDEIALQMGHMMPDLRTTGHYIKFDRRYLAAAKGAIEEYVRGLNRLTKRDLLIPALNLLSKPPKSGPEPIVQNLDKSNIISELVVVGATGIEPVTPTMSR